jgi:outer membrane protein TolC
MIHRTRLEAGVVLIIALALETLGAQTAGTAPTRDLALDEALKLAKTNSVLVRANTAASEAAQRAVWTAQSALLPKISAGASGAWLANPPKGMSVAKGALGDLPLWVPATTSPGSVYTGPFTYHPVTLPNNDWQIVDDTKNSYFKGNLTFTQPLVAWGKIAAGIALASLEAEIAEVKRSGAELDALRLAKRSYNAALLSRDSAAVLAELCDLAASIAADRRKALEAGTATKADALSSEADLAGLEAKLIEAREAEKSALESLAYLTGLEPGTLRLVTGLRDNLPSIDEEALKKAAPQSSADWGTARARLAQAGRKLDLERGSFIMLPNLALFANLEAAGQTVPFSTTSWIDKTWSWDLTVGLSAQIEVFDGGANLARISEARSSLAAARAGLEGSEQGARIEVRRAVDAARRAEALLASKRAAAAWSAETLRNARASAEAELISRGELNGASIREASSRLELLAARYDVAEAAADLERLAGKELP